MTELDRRSPAPGPRRQLRRPNSHSLDVYMAKWNLVADGEPVLTASSSLLPVRAAGAAAMLKISTDLQERVGGGLMEWWDGDGAARILAREGDALLMERATGARSLASMSRSDDDTEACRVLCASAGRLQRTRPNPHPKLTPLETRFRSLGLSAARHGGMIKRCATSAQFLLSAPRDIAVLHGDLHHDNVLDFGDRGWLAIDPKGLIGERGFDYANIFCNPDLSDPVPPVARLPQVFAARLSLITELAGMERSRLLLWILAWAGLSAAWNIEAGRTPATSLAIVELAVADLDR